MVERIQPGKVGFFWIVPGCNGSDVVIGEGIDLSQAEHYGNALTHPGGHYEFWEALRKLGPSLLRGKGVRSLILADEYEDWPRGRVIFQLGPQRFDIIAHPSILRPPRLNLIYKAFELSRRHAALRNDYHYRCSTRLR